MDLHDAKRIEIIIEAPLGRRLTDALDQADVTGYTVLPVHGGSGRSGRWTRAGQISPGQGMVAVVVLIRGERADSVINAAFDVLEPHIGIVSITNAQVLRAERF
jgi:nitrogen regulatory protein PII